MFLFVLRLAPRNNLVEAREIDAVGVLLIHLDHRALIFRLPRLQFERADEPAHHASVGRGEFGVVQATRQVEALDAGGTVTEQLSRRVRLLHDVVQRHPHRDDAGGAGLDRLLRQRFYELGRCVHRPVRRGKNDDGAVSGRSFGGVGNFLRGRAETTRELLSVLPRGTVDGGEIDVNKAIVAWIWGAGERS